MSDTPKRALSLRTTLLIMIVVGLAYVGGVAGYMALRVAPVADDLSRETEPILELFSGLTERSAQLETVIEDLHRLVDHDQVDLDTLATLREAILPAEGRTLPMPYASAPVHLRVVLSRVDDQIARLESYLLEIIGLLELGRDTQAMARIARADTRGHDVQTRLASAQQLALKDLIDRERRLHRSAEEMEKVILAWVVLGLILLPGLVMTARRRIARPLTELRAGLTRLANGDLNTRVPVRYDDEVGSVIEHFNEMTRVVRLRAEEQGRFAAAGELLAGVAHEVNNPLMAISTLASSRLASGGVAPELESELKLIHEQSRRAGRIIEGLLRFLRSGHDSEPVHVDVNAAVRDALNLVGYQFSVDDIEVVTDLDADLPPSRAGTGQIEQVLVNLLSNAIDALRTVRPPRRLTLETSSDGLHVQVAVQDNGPGISAEIADRMFQPFVTTKGRKGTGLGLYISRELLREFGGELGLSSPPGDGARFVVRLPIATDASPALEDAGDPTANPMEPPTRGVDARSSDGTAAGRRETAAADLPLDGVRVLIAEDEVTIRRLLASYLARRGAAVHQAANGEEALAQLEIEDMDIVIADIRMPRMDGLEMFERLRARRPGMLPRVLRRRRRANRMEWPNGMDPHDIYALMRNLTSPLVCLTSAWREKRNGMISNSAIRASLVPDRPRVAVFVLKRHLSHELIFESGAFGLHLLHSEQFDLVRRMGFRSGRDIDKLEGLAHWLGATGAPMLEDALARFDCRVINAMDAGAATCFLGEAVTVERGTGDAPMTADHWRRHMPEEWRPEYEANLRSTQEWAAGFGDRIEPLVWRDLDDGG